MRRTPEHCADTVFDQALAFAFGDWPACIDNLDSRAGGQSFMGICRGANPEWLGWFILDRRHPDLACDGSWPDVPSDLMGLVRSFYREHYWRAVFADAMPAALAAVVFDSAVTHGRNMALRFLQEALNTLYGFRRIDVDGIFRRDSRQALDLLLTRHDWYLKTLVAETLRIRRGCCDLIACGDGRARALCRARLLGAQRMADGYLPGCAQCASGDEPGLELAC